MIFMIAFSKQFKIAANSINLNSVFYCKKNAEQKSSLYLYFLPLAARWRRETLYLDVLPETQNQKYKKLRTVSYPS